MLESVSSSFALEARGAWAISVAANFTGAASPRSVTIGAPSAARARLPAHASRPARTTLALRACLARFMAFIRKQASSQERSADYAHHLSQRTASTLAEENPCGSPGNAFHYLRECIQGQPSPAWPALTSELRRAVTSRVKDTGPRQRATLPRSSAPDSRPQLPTINSRPINHSVRLHNPRKILLII